MIIKMEQLTKELKSQIIRYVIYLVIVLGLTTLAFFLTVGNDLSKIASILVDANAWFILVILAIVISCFFVRSLAVYFLTRSMFKGYPLHRAIGVDQVATLYRMVTPAGLGSHIMETHVFHKQKISISSALSILAMYSIVYQVVLILYNIITLIVKGGVISEIGYINIVFSDTSNINIPLWVLISIGFIFNLLVIAFILALSYWNKFFQFIDGPLGSLGHKMKIIKDLNKYHNKLEGAKNNFRDNLKHLFGHIPTLVMTALCFFVYITISYSTPYFAGLALNNTSPSSNFWDSVFYSNLHQMVTCVIPIPGSSVVSELFFLRLFYPASGAKFYESEEMTKAALILWRSLTFIFPLIISCFYTLIYSPRKEPYYEYENNQNQEAEE